MLLLLQNTGFVAQDCDFFNARKFLFMKDACGTLVIEIMITEHSFRDTCSIYDICTNLKIVDPRYLRLAAIYRSRNIRLEDSQWP